MLLHAFLEELEVEFLEGILRRYPSFIPSKRLEVGGSFNILFAFLLNHDPAPEDPLSPHI